MESRRAESRFSRSFATTARTPIVAAAALSPLRLPLQRGCRQQPHQALAVQPGHLPHLAQQLAPPRPIRSTEACPLPLGVLPTLVDRQHLPGSHRSVLDKTFNRGHCTGLQDCRCAITGACAHHLPLLFCVIAVPIRGGPSPPVEVVAGTMEPRIELHPDICNGRLVIRGTRVTVQTILEFLGAGDTIEQVLEAFPALTREDILAAIRFSSRLMANHYHIERVA